MGNRRKIYSEQDIGKEVSEYFVANGWDVYAEVIATPGIADIVAICGKIIWIVECKVSFSLAVIDQAIRWNGWANLVSVAVEGSRWSRSCAGQSAMRYNGIGAFGTKRVWLTEKDNYSERLVAQIGMYPKLNRNHNGKILKCLREEQKQSIPGSQAGEAFTDFKGTVLTLERFIRSNPGITMKEAIKGLKEGNDFSIGETKKIRHHYSSDYCAITNLIKHIKSGLIKTIRIDESSRLWLSSNINEKDIFNGK